MQNSWDTPGKHSGQQNSYCAGCKDDHEARAGTASASLKVLLGLKLCNVLCNSRLNSEIQITDVRP